MKMYSPSSPTLSDHIGHPNQQQQQQQQQSPTSLGGSLNHHNHHHHLHQHQHLQQQQQRAALSSQCLRFKYFATFVISTICLALLSASLATHKWIVSKPIRVLRLNGGQTNFTALMLTAHGDQYDDRPAASSSSHPHPHPHPHQQQAAALLSSLSAPALAAADGQLLSSQNNKFQGEIYFGLFMGVKVLNPGFGDRVSPISVFQAYFAKDNGGQQELINFKLWLVTLASVVLAILFALISSIFAIINFVMTPRGNLTGPIGLVIWNASACFACLLALVSWFVEFFVRLQANVLTLEEVQNGWTSENRSQFGYSYYFVLLAFVFHLVNIFIVSIVQFETWTASTKAAKRQSRPVCEGVIMLY